MEMKIKLFTALRDAVGRNEVSLPWRQGMIYLDILEKLKKDFQGMASLLECSLAAVNGGYAEQDRMLMPEDEAAVLPPVSGG